MEIVCYQCNEQVGYKTPFSDHRRTHALCYQCLRQLLDQQVVDKQRLRSQGTRDCRFGYFRFQKQGKVHYIDEVPGKSGLWTICGRYVAKRRLIPADIVEAERDLCKICKKVEDTEFWGWEQML